MPLPTFIVAGAQKGGTTTLHAMIERHPEVFVTRPKEIHYFDRHYAKGLEWYSSMFQPGPGQRAWGESTPLYMYEPLARRRMCRDLPDARLILILRDPVARAYSHYWMNRSKGVEDIETFEEAVRIEAERRAASSRRIAARYAYLDRGLYIDQLNALEASYGRERLHVLLLSDLTASTTLRLTEVFTFLGVDPTMAVDIPLLHQKSFRKGATASTVTSATYPPLEPATADRLREYFAEPNERLSAWLGRDLTSWNQAPGQ